MPPFLSRSVGVEERKGPGRDIIPPSSPAAWERKGARGEGEGSSCPPPFPSLFRHTLIHPYYVTISAQSALQITAIGPVGVWVSTTTSER